MPIPTSPARERYTATDLTPKPTLAHPKVLAAAKNKAVDLQHASAELREDKEVILTAVRQNGLALQFASCHLKQDEDFMREAVMQDEAAWQSNRSY